jgi:V/A-type H+-transporting ATPase subunit E
MDGMENIREAILSKVRGDAQDLINEAEEKARQEIARAEREKEKKFEGDKYKMIREAEGEAARMLAQASIKARQELLNAKASVINEITSRTRDAVSGASNDEGFLNLTREAVSALGVDKVRIHVSAKDVATAQRVLKRDEALAGKIAEIKEFDCTGGVIAESMDGRVRIDNTYGSRLEKLLARSLPDISKELFQGS